MLAFFFCKTNTPKTRNIVRTFYKVFTKLSFVKWRGEMVTSVAALLLGKVKIFVAK